MRDWKRFEQSSSGLIVITLPLVSRAVGKHKTLIQIGGVQAEIQT
jgi:hypothetical protein